MFYSYVLSEAFISIVYLVLQAVSDKVCHEYFWSEEDTVSGGELWKTAGIFLLLIIGSARRCLGKAGIQQADIGRTGRKQSGLITRIRSARRVSARACQKKGCTAGIQNGIASLAVSCSVH